jgi:hypothetical protein
MAAVGAAIFSIKAVHRQIKASDDATQRQIDHAQSIEQTRRDAQRSAARGVLPLALSALNDFGHETMSVLYDVHGICVSGVLPKTATLPTFPTFPDEIVSSLKDMLEFSPAEERRFIWQTLVRVQVIRTRISELVKGHARSSTMITESNVEAYLLDAAELYGRASALYRFARGATNEQPRIITRSQIAEALRFVIFDQLYDDMVDKYGLQGDEQWGEQWLS